jgi:hypothetical protein
MEGVSETQDPFDFLTAAAGHHHQQLLALVLVRVLLLLGPATTSLLDQPCAVDGQMLLEAVCQV